FSLHLNLSEENLEGLNKTGLIELIIKEAKGFYKAKEADIGGEILSRLERIVMLQTIDALWKDHLLVMDHLKEGIGWRGYGQKNPIEEYKREGFDLYAGMIFRMKEESVERLFKVQVARQEDIDRLAPAEPQRFVLSRGEGPGSEKQQPIKRDSNKVGRNDPCPCGSGKKHKKCCGK
ncbi:MAG: SEC-C metal-binding domain-containing protein, partial [Thermodesulfobacteriota bacterium]